MYPNRRQKGTTIMAYYEYECQMCRHVFTVSESFDEHDRQRKPACPNCGSKNVRQLLSAVHVKTSKKS
jgi:putative FmdB family regulatory protein